MWRPWVYWSACFRKCQQMDCQHLQMSPWRLARSLSLRLQTMRRMEKIPATRTWSKCLGSIWTKRSMSTRQRMQMGFSLDGTPWYNRCRETGAGFTSNASNVHIRHFWSSYWHVSICTVWRFLSLRKNRKSSEKDVRCSAQSWKKPTTCMGHGWKVWRMSDCAPVEELWNSRLWCGSPCWQWPIPSSHVFAHDASRQQQFEGGQGQSGFYKECLSDASTTMRNASMGKRGRRKPTSLFFLRKRTTWGKCIYQLKAEKPRQLKSCSSSRENELDKKPMQIAELEREASQLTDESECQTSKTKIQCQSTVHGGAVCQFICSCLEDSWGATRTVDLHGSLWWEWCWVAKQGVLSSFRRARCRFRTRGDRIKSVLRSDCKMAENGSEFRPQQSCPPCF